MKEARTANSRFAKAGVSCFYESEVLNSSFVHLMKFSAENPAFAKRQTVSRHFKDDRNSMKKFKEIQTLVIILLVIVLNLSCNEETHIDKYDVNVDSLKTLPDGFYAYRRGNIYFDNEKLMIWYTLDNSGNVKDIFKVNDLIDKNADKTATLNKFSIDTTENKIVMQRFIDLSRKFKFGHIKVDRLNKVSFSNRDGLSEQYVITFNDSLKEKYSNNKDFKVLTNGWFEYVDR